MKTKMMRMPPRKKTLPRQPGRTLRGFPLYQRRHQEISDPLRPLGARLRANKILIKMKPAAEEARPLIQDHSGG